MRPAGRTILLFTRAPRAEARAKRLPIDGGTCLFAGFLRSWQEQAADAGADLLVVTPASSCDSLARLLPRARICAQKGDSFGDRVESAFQQAFRDGSQSVLMVCGDGPPLDLVDIREAFAHLEFHDRALVLTPASDGGVNAIGFSARANRALGTIAWQSSDVCRQLQLAATQNNLALLLTSPGHDLDCARNIATLYRLSRGQSAWSAFRWLLLSLLSSCGKTPASETNADNRFTGHSRVTRGPPLSLRA